MMLPQMVVLVSHKLSARHVDHGGDGAGEVDDAAAPCPSCHLWRW